MPVDVIMPKLGESITEGTILEWKKKVGEDIGKDETLLEISTDKVDSEVPSPSQGKIIEILYKVNDVVPVGEVIARIGGKSDDIVKSKPADKQEKKVETSKEEPPKQAENKSMKIDRKDSKRFYSPLVRAMPKSNRKPSMPNSFAQHFNDSIINFLTSPLLAAIVLPHPLTSLKPLSSSRK